MTFPVNDIIRKIVLTAAKTRVDCRLGKPNFKGQFSSDDAFLSHFDSTVGNKLYFTFLNIFFSIFLWRLEGDRTYRISLIGIRGN
jgi:hypothetical protein